jgi:hypothetical protein
MHILFIIGDNDTFHYGMLKKLKCKNWREDCKHKFIYDRPHTAFKQNVWIWSLAYTAYYTINM